MAKEIRYLTFSGDDNFSVLVDEHARLIAAACNRNYPNLVEDQHLTNAEYNELNEKVKTAMLKFACAKSGVTVENETDMLFANDNTMFRSVLNSIITRSIGAAMVKYDNPMMSAFVEIDTVRAGDSKTYEIDTKALPIAQRGTYTSNVTTVPSYAKSAVTITPKVYANGISLDFIRILANGYDWGRDVARVYAGLIYAQYALAAGKIFNKTALVAPLYNATFTLPTYVQLADDVAMLSGTGVDSVVAFGTRAAFNAISSVATNGGFMTKDEMIRDGYVKEICNVRSVVLDNFTNYAAPFTAANAASLRALPNDVIVLTARGADPAVRLVREDYIRAIETPAHENTLNRMEYSFFQAFDAAIATASAFGVQNTAS